MRLLRLNIRSQLLLVLVIVSGCATILMGMLGYRMSRNAVRSYALGTLQQAAESRRHAVMAQLTLHRDHVNDFIEHVELSCGASSILNRICAREALAAFRRSESAVCAVLTATGHPLRSGTCPDLTGASEAEWMHVFRTRDKTYYAVQKTNHEYGAKFIAVYDAADIISGGGQDAVGASGRTYVVLPAVQSVPQPAAKAVSNLCSSRNEVVRAPASAPLLRQSLPLPEFGGCIVAEQQEREAVSSALAQRKVALAMTGVVALFSIGLAFWFSQILTAPIARLTARARALQHGDFDTPVPSAGPTEVRHFAEVFASMATTLKQSRAAQMQRERVEASAQIAAVLAHEINNPLSAVTYALALLSRASNLDDNSHALLSIAREEAERMAKISKQLLGLYRGNIGVTRFHVSAMLDRAIENESARLRGLGVKLRRRFEKDVEISGVEPELRHAMINLLRSLEGSLRHGDSVTVHMFPSLDWKRPETRGVRIVVHDTGRGLALEPQVAGEPFGASPAHKGSGVSLWVASTAVKKHGGNVRIRTSKRAGRSGTCISVFLPCNAILQAA